ncbi:MAG: helix-turn-helix domain-containing protein [Thermodesulfobacteriota bacterium]
MLETIGQYLRREREARNISLEELSQGTRINKAFLEAIERDDFNFFPQPNFIIGFLKGYTRYLGLSSEEVIKRYLRQAELESRKIDFRQLALFPKFIPNQEDSESGTLKADKVVSKIKISKWTYIQVGIILLAMGLSFYLQQIIRQMEAPPKGMKNSSLATAFSSTSEKEGVFKESTP